MSEIMVKYGDEDVTLDELRRVLNVPADACIGCWLGDCHPDMHDLGYGCAYGKGAFS